MDFKSGLLDRAGAFVDLFPELNAAQSAAIAGLLPSVNAGATRTSAVEGALREKRHRYRERDGGLPRLKKRSVLNEQGRLQCEVCGFDFHEAYGDLGKGFLECHHKIPLHELTDEVVTNLDDLALLCANCHRMVHASVPWLTLEQLRERRKPSR
jgi:5-methylcytosine-specific restriction protein A